MTEVNKHNEIKYTLDIKHDSNMMFTNFSVIPKNCTTLYIKGKFIYEGFFHGRIAELGDKKMGSYDLNSALKELKQLQVLDLSGCIDAETIYPGFYDLTVNSIILPPNVKTLPTISNCPNLTIIIGLGLIKVENIHNCPRLEYIEFNKALTEIRIPNTNIRQISIPNVETIEYDAFRNCTNLEKIELSPKLKVIRKDAFRNCINLYKVEIPEYCEIEEGAFDGCSSLRILNLPSTLKIINKNVFANCVSLDLVIGGINVHELCSGAFMNCKSLQYLPFVPKIISDDAFDTISDHHYGIVLSTYSTSILWSFDTFSFYLCRRPINDDMRNCLVKFSSERRINYEKRGVHLELKYSPCQFAFDLYYNFNIDDFWRSFGSQFSSMCSYIEEIEAHKLIYDKIPDIQELYSYFKDMVSKLNLSEIVDEYHTIASESQTWKIGGDNTFHRIRRTYTIYTDCYIEKFLPIYDEEYHESACHDYSDDIDYDIQENQNMIDEDLKQKFLKSYKQEEHVVCLVNHHISSFIEKSARLQDVIHLDLAKNALNYYFKYLSRHQNSDRLRSLSILCSGETPNLEYKVWLRNRYKQLFNY